MALWAGNESMAGKSHNKAKAWSAIGSTIVGAGGTLSIVQSDRARHGLETTGKKGPDPRTPRPGFVQGTGLTPRLFDHLMKAKPAPVEALPSSYLPTISRHVESVAPSKNVFAQYWCPVVVEDKVGGRHMLHVDPLVVRTFRRTVADELQHVREKRKRMLKRIRHIRQDFPQIEARDASARLRREIDDAQARADEQLLVKFPASERVSTLHIFLEVSPQMIQLEMVCRQLIQELPAALETASVQRVSFNILGSGSPNHSTSAPGDQVSMLAPFDCQDSAAWTAACAWLLSLRSSAPLNETPQGKEHRALHFTNGLRWVTTSEAFSVDSVAQSKPAVLLLACSKPADLEACIDLARRSSVPLHIVGVFGLSAEDPEPGLQQLTDAAAEGSSFRLFFGSVYWSQFISTREQQLRVLHERSEDSLQGVGAADKISGDNEIVSGKIFEMRLIERVMRECYSEEQQCEEELTCATRVFERTLIEREDLLAVLRGANSIRSSAAPSQMILPATAR